MRALRLLPVWLLALIGLVSLLAPILPIPDPLQVEMVKRMAPPSLEFWLGKDEYGRDMLSRIIWGMRISLAVGAASALLACVVGTALGIAAAYMRGMVETVIMRLMDVLLCLPALLVAMLFVSLSGPGALALVPILALVFVPNFARVVYSGVLTVRSRDFVEATRGMGAGHTYIMSRTILPNVAGAVLVQLSLTAVSAVILESGLSFLGLGVVPPEASLGMMIGAARSTMYHAPFLLVIPSVALTVLILVLNSVCDVLRDVFDPRTAAVRGAEK